MTETERANQLYWNIVWIIEPALWNHHTPLHEPIDEKARRLALETLAKGKAKAILGELREAGLLPVDFVPSIDAP